MNIVDNNFYSLIKCLNLQSEEEILENIKSRFLNLPKETQKSFESYFNQFDYWGTLNIDSNDYNEIELKAKCLKSHLNDFIELYQNLKDYKSKKLLYGILNNWYKYDFTTIKEVRENTYKHYFDLDIIPHCQNEIIVDLGSYIGDTIIDYINTYGENSYQRIYTYEITPRTFATLKNNLCLFNNIIFNQKAVSNFNGSSFIKDSKVESSANRINKNGNTIIPTTTLDNDISEKISIIKMDIEGEEEKAILGSKNHIKEDNPVLIISVYHKNEDLFKLYQIIKDLNPNYEFYLRYYGGYVLPTEIVLYAIPNKSTAC